MGGGAPAGGCLHGPGPVVGGVRVQGRPDGRDGRLAVQTALLAVDAAKGSKAFGRYLTQVLVQAEEDADAAQGTFDGIQPPDRRADELRGRLDDLLTQATDTLAELRIAARRGHTAELAEPAAPLEELAGKLHAFAEAHG